MCIDIEVLRRRFCLAFSFSTSFNTTPPIDLVKVILIQNSKSVKGDYSCWLMLMCRWAGVNTTVQMKFRSTIHLLGQHFLIQSDRSKHQMNL